MKLKNVKKRSNSASNPWRSQRDGWRDFEKSSIAVIEREKVCRNQGIVYFEPSIENLEDFVDVHVQLAIMRNTQTGIELISSFFVIYFFVIFLTACPACSTNDKINSL